MRIRDFMTPYPVSCGPDTPLTDVALYMARHDCGAIPIVDDAHHPLGVVTDRDIVTRALAGGRNPLELQARDVMTHPPVTLFADDSLQHCCDTMEAHQIRRVVVVDHLGHLCGIVAQADVARTAPEDKAAEVVQEISLSTQPTF